MNVLRSLIGRVILESATDAALGLAYLPMPSDVPRVYAAGADPDRLLLMGTTTVAGLGVTSYQLGVGGHLARRISGITGRGVDLDLEGSATMTVAVARRLLAERRLSEYDAVVLFLGTREAIRFHSARAWTREVRALLRQVSEGENAPHIFIAAVAPVYRYAAVRPRLRARLQRHLKHQNELTASVSLRFPNVTFLSSWEPPDGPYELNSRAYDGWAEHFAPVIAPFLTGNAIRVITPVDEFARQAALDALRVVGSDPDERFDRIARTARDLLGVSGASVTFLDHDRQWVKSAVTMTRGDTERTMAFCNTTMNRPGPFVVEDASIQDAITGHPRVVGDDRVRFFAGFPLEAPTGERVGAFCVVDTKPRHFTSDEATLLRDLALQLQALLWSDSDRAPTLGR